MFHMIELEVVFTVILVIICTVSCTVNIYEELTSVPPQQQLGTVDDELQMIMEAYYTIPIPKKYSQSQQEQDQEQQQQQKQQALQSLQALF